MKFLLKIVMWLVGLLVLLLVLVRWIGSPIVTAQINKKLAELPDYSGHVETVELALWRGTVSLKNFDLKDRREATDSVVKLKHASLSIALGPLFKGKVGGRGHLSGLGVHMVKTAPVEPDAKTKGKQNDAPATRDWQNVLQKTFPIEISRFEIEDASVEFEDRTKQPLAKITVDQIHLVATSLSNRPDGSEEMPAQVTLQARVAGTGKLTVDIQANPAATQPRFHATMELKDLGLVGMHDFLEGYALIDVSAGTFEVFTEVNAAGGHYDGYVKPFFKGLEFKAVPDPNKNFAQRTATTVASAVTNLLKNDQDQVATKAPFKGDFADNQVDVWVTVENLLRNAFVQSLREGLEGHSPTG